MYISDFLDSWESVMMHLISSSFPLANQFNGMSCIEFCMELGTDCKMIIMTVLWNSQTYTLWCTRWFCSVWMCRHSLQLWVCISVLQFLKKTFVWIFCACSRHCNPSYCLSGRLCVSSVTTIFCTCLYASTTSKHDILQLFFLEAVSRYKCINVSSFLYTPTMYICIMSKPWMLLNNSSGWLVCWILCVMKALLVLYVFFCQLHLYLLQYWLWNVLNGVNYSRTPAERPPWKLMGSSLYTGVVFD